MANTKAVLFAFMSSILLFSVFPLWLDVIPTL